MGAEIGTGALIGKTGVAMEKCRERWFESFSWIHFVLMGTMLFTYNLMKKRGEEWFYISWPTSGFKQFWSLLKLGFGFVILEILAYLIQFVGNAIYIAVTSLLFEVTIPNFVSLKYLAQQIDILRVFWETCLAALGISYLDRRNRRKNAAYRRAEAKQRQMAQEEQRREENARSMEERRFREKYEMYSETIPDSKALIEGGTKVIEFEELAKSSRKED